MYCGIEKPNSSNYKYRLLISFVIRVPNDVLLIFDIEKCIQLIKKIRSTDHTDNFDEKNAKKKLEGLYLMIKNS